METHSAALRPNVKGQHRSPGTQSQYFHDNVHNLRLVILSLWCVKMKSTMISRFGLALLLASALLINPIVRAEDEGVDDDEYADTARAMLIVRKFTKEDIVVQGKNVTVEVDIFNSGIR